jgi:hypothetical protein
MKMIFDFFTETIYTIKVEGLDREFRIHWSGETNGYYSESSFSNIKKVLKKY